MTQTLGYWDIRGLAQPARLMLGYVEAEFEEARYVTTDAPEFNRDSWFSVKFKLGLDFPNLPYFIDGDVKVTQSNAVYRYIARKYNLYGSTDKDKAMIDMLADQVMDLRNDIFFLVYMCKDRRDYEEKKKKYDVQIIHKLEPFEKFLGEKRWLIGEQISFPDFHLYEMLDQNMVMCPGCLSGLPGLAAFHQRFQELPTIKKYMASEKFIKSPINNKNAFFIG